MTAHPDPGHPDHDPVRDDQFPRIVAYEQGRDNVQWPDDESEHCCMTGVPDGD